MAIATLTTVGVEVVTAVGMTMALAAMTTAAMVEADETTTALVA